MAPPKHSSSPSSKVSTSSASGLGDTDKQIDTTGIQPLKPDAGSANLGVGGLGNTDRQIESSGIEPLKPEAGESVAKTDSRSHRTARK